jgi:hypothetical protein
VKIWLTVTNPSNTDTLAVTHSSGSRTLNPGVFSQLVPNSPGVRNRVRFRVFPAENRVEILLFPEGNVLDVGGVPKYCQLSASPSFDSWQFSYTNANGNSATSYRFNSFTAAAASGRGCDCNNRRIGDAANPSVITFSAPAAIPVGQRFPVDLVLVLDRSGSMSGTIPGSADIKMDALHWAAGQLIDVWRMEGGPPEDRLAVIWFETTTEIENPPNGFVTRSAASPSTTWEDLRTIVEGKTTADSTAMGDGITQAFNIHSTIPEAQRNDLFIILLTDGIQNEGKLILPGNSAEAVAVNTAAGVPALTEDALAFFDQTPPTDQYVYLAGKCTPVQAVGIGSPDGSPTDFASLLDDIAAETGGKVDINFGSTMDVALRNAIIDSLKGNTITTVAEVDSTLAAASPSAAPTEFELSSAVSRALLVLGWRSPPSGLELLITRPDNTSFTVPVNQRRDNPLYTVQAIDLPANGPPGRWSATVRRTGGNTAATPYHFSVVAIEDRLAFNVDFTNFDYGTGEPIILRAAVADRGVPIAGLGNSIQVRVKRPQSGLGNLLRNANVPQSVLTTDPPGQPADIFRNSPYSRKVFSLMQSASFLDLASAKQDSRIFTLFDDGNSNNGDAVAGDGIYSMKFSGDDTRIPGMYNFDLAMDFNRPLLGRIVRAEKREIEVSVKVADPVETEFAATKTGAGQYRIDVTPADRFGNFMGPGQARRIQVTLSGGGSIAGPPVDERENGTYTFNVVGVPSGADPTATLIVNGTNVRSATLSQLSTPNKRFAIFGGLGSNFPHGDFNTFFNSGVSTQFGFEYRFTNRFSAEGTFGYDRFSTAFGPFHLNLYRLSADAKFYPVIGAFQLGVFGGGGVYHFDPSSTHGGLNIGAVGEYRINTSWSIESTYNFHNVFTSGSNTRFSTLQGGVRFRF